MSDQALGHVTVVEFGGYAAGPAIGKYFANFGARVIHVESADRPDGFRLQYPPWKDGKVSLNGSGCFAFFNDSKLGVTIDLKNPHGLDRALDLVERADVVIENMRPGVMDRLGLGYAELQRRNPRLVMLSTSNLGQTGPHATHPGFGSQLSSLSGFTELIGQPGGPPQFLYGPYIDLIAVAYGGAVVLAALDRAARTGRGAFIDLAQYEAGLQFVAPALLGYAAAGVVARRDGNRDPIAAPHGCFRCRGDQWCAISCWDDEEWTRLCGVLDHAEWTADPRFRTAADRRAHEDLLNRLLGDRTRGEDARALMARLQAARVHAGAVNTMRDLFDDPQLAARGLWQARSNPDLGPLRYRMVSYQLDRTPGRVGHAAPSIGEHNDDVFKEWSA